MRPADLEALVPGLREARAEEHRNRALAFAGIPWTVGGFELVPLTPRHRLELQLVQNAFEVRRRPEKEDLLQFAWRLSPHFGRNARFLPFLGPRNPIKRKIGRMTADEVTIASLAILDYLAAMKQDLPEARDRNRNSINPPEYYVHWIAGEAAFYLRQFQGFTLSSYLDTPYLVLQQLHRAWLLNTEDDPNFINNSDSLVQKWKDETVRKYAQPRQN